MILCLQGLDGLIERHIVVKSVVCPEIVPESSTLSDLTYFGGPLSFVCIWILLKLLNRVFLSHSRYEIMGSATQVRFRVNCVLCRGLALKRFDGKSREY